jgi:hypothetical protein
MLDPAEHIVYTWVNIGIIIELMKIFFFMKNTENDSHTSGHGPFEGGGKFLYLEGKMGPDGDYTNEEGRIFSPIYSKSAERCEIDLFYYINGNTGLVPGDSSEKLAAIGHYLK